MREPAFWYRPPSLMSRLLAPLGAIYGAVTARRMARAAQRAIDDVRCRIDIFNDACGGAAAAVFLLGGGLAQLS